MEKESSSEGEQISPKLWRKIKKRGKVVSSTSLSSMIKRVVDRVVHN